MGWINQEDLRRPVAVFDYDGTMISGQSGKILALWLARQGYLSASVILRLILWGFRYKFHLPYRQDEARELIFSDLKSKDPQEVRDIMESFHHSVLKSEVRPRAMRELGYRKAEGCTCLLATATFSPITNAAARYLGFDGYIATEMETDDLGDYTGVVQGDVAAGQAKVDLVKAWADCHLGEGAWYCAYAYGDHYSDIALLSSAVHPCAVCPGPTLRKYARQHSWPIVDWESL